MVREWLKMTWNVWSLKDLYHKCRMARSKVKVIKAILGNLVYPIWRTRNEAVWHKLPHSRLLAALVLRPTNNSPLSCSFCNHSPTTQQLVQVTLAAADHSTAPTAVLDPSNAIPAAAPHPPYPRSSWSGIGYGDHTSLRQCVDFEHLFCFLS
ncbi:unnamed protein product [Amaranthus hypochondriacus]